MLKIKINDKEYSIKSSWEDVTISDAVKLYAIIDRFPDNLKKLYRLMFEKDGKDKILGIEFTEEEEFKTIPTLQGELIEAMSDIPKELIEFFHDDLRMNFYSKYIMPIAVGLLVYPYNYEMANMRSFKFKGKEYLFPQQELDVNGNVRPCAQLETIAFSESSDLRLAIARVEYGKFNYMANIVSILCRPFGEKYNEQVCLERAKEFKDLPLNIVWEVFFYAIQFMDIFKIISLTYLDNPQITSVRAMLKNMDGIRH